MRWLKLIAFFGFFVCALCLSNATFAQPVMELDAIVVEGRVQRPQASYIIQRASLEFGIQAKRRSFVSKIVNTIEDQPF